MQHLLEHAEEFKRLGRDRRAAWPGCSDWLIDSLLLTQARGDMAAIAQTVPAWQALDTARMRPNAEARPWVMTNLKTLQGLEVVVNFIERKGLLA